MDAREFYDPETASSAGASHVPSHPLNTPSPRGMRSRDSGMLLDTRISMGTSGDVSESLTAREGRLSFLREFKELSIFFMRIGIRKCYGTW